MDIMLDGALIRTEEQFHVAMKEATGSNGYGRNLDALFDLLVEVVGEPITLRWTNASQSRAGIGDRFDRILDVIFDAAAECGDGSLRLCLETSQ